MKKDVVYMIKMTVTGTVDKIDKFRMGKELFFTIGLLSVDTGNPQPKGLPKPSDVKINLRMNERQYRKLQNDLEKEGLTVRIGTPLVAEGRPYYGDNQQNLPELITYLIESIEVKRMARAREKYPYGLLEIPIEEIVIPDEFVKARQEKVEAAVDYFKKHNRFEKAIEIKINGEGKPQLVDGFAKYLAAKEMGLMNIQCFQPGEAVDK